MGRLTNIYQKFIINFKYRNGNVAMVGEYKDIIKAFILHLK